MHTLTKLSCPFAVAAVLAFTSAPAHAQLFKEEDMGQMKQFAPMFEMMKHSMGKKRYGAMMRKMGPMLERMGNNGGGFGGGAGRGGGGGFDFDGFSGGDFGGMANMLGSGQGMGDFRRLIGGFTGRHGRRGWRHHHFDF